MSECDRRFLVIVATPELLPEAHLQTCDRIADFVPATFPESGAPCSGYVSDLDEVRERFSDVIWCECLEDVACHEIAHASAATFTEGFDYIETLNSGDTRVDVHYQSDEEDFVFTIDGRVGARLCADAIRDEEARPELFAERAARAVRAIRWADQDWRSRRPSRAS